MWGCRPKQEGRKVDFNRGGPIKEHIVGPVTTYTASYVRSRVVDYLSALAL